ncbi:NAD-dependent epimerase/dehydratase family protein [Allorhizocola rhizosphaerae]|uniref:NAD-dependent epimerase/dehydratase family protein n=1 Tax=Allorhizocola rhizosphaerae TaxID=1872709 RepID=UPI000E3BB2BD|nr:NAD(P)H-binding protein [Allorhizocola rhizosphaerae]
MKVVVFGATGMIGQGVLRECLVDPRVTEVLTVGRKATGQGHAKLREIVPADLYDLSTVEDQLTGVKACFFCLGVSSAGMSGADYRRVTYELTIAAAKTLARLNAGMTFVYVSGAGTDANGRSMWSQVKGKTESDLLAMDLDGYMFRPGYIHPSHGEKSRTRLYAALYVVAKPLYPLLKRLAPNAVTTTEDIARAMINLAVSGTEKKILHPKDINSAALPL